MNILFLLLSLAAAQTQTPAQTSLPSWLNPRMTALNPRISASLDVVHQAGESRAETWTRIREAELAFQADVDPYARLDLFVAKPHGEEMEIEEGYATLTSLPWGLAARGGQFFQNFGRLNYVHQHELPQVDRPLALASLLGPEGLRGVGAEVSRGFAPFGLFTELSYALVQDLGEADEEEPETATVLDTDGNSVTVRLHEEEATEPRKFRDFAHVAKVRTFKDITDSLNIDLSGSGALHQPKEQLHRSLLGAELTLRWRPAQQGLYRSFIWRNEMIWSRRRLTDEFDRAGVQTASAAKVDRRGAYSYAEYQWAQRWRGGLRGDYVEDPSLRDVRSVTRALSPYVTFHASEFQKVRLQFQRRWTPARRQDDRVMLQWNLVLGPHGAHAF